MSNKSNSSLTQDQQEQFEQPKGTTKSKYHKSDHNNLTDTFQRFSSRITNRFNQIFYRIGYNVGLHPWNTIICCLVLVIACGMGSIKFYNEKNPIELWIPRSSSFYHDTYWLFNTYKEGYRIESVMITSKTNVLQPGILKSIAKLTNEVTKLKATLNNGTDVRWNDVCFKIPIIAGLPQDNDDDGESSDKKNTKLDPSVLLPSMLFCLIMNNLESGCLQENLIDLWNSDERRIGNLTSADILNTINTAKINPITGHDLDHLHLLANVKRNATTHLIESANGLIINWMVYLNFSNTDASKSENSAGTEEWASEEIYKWEGEFLKLMDKFQSTEFGNDTELYYEAGRSFGDISSKVIFQEMHKVFAGAILMFIFMIGVLSKFNWIELRVIVCNFGLLSILFAYISLIGICSAFGFPYGPVHSSLPFLLMGLGVDDMFVMMAALNIIKEKRAMELLKRQSTASISIIDDQQQQQTIESEQNPNSNTTNSSIPDCIGNVLKMSGISITITSLTDIIAFLVGASTSIPSLKSFCIYAAVGILLTYFYAITFFLAIVTLDEYRIKSNRNSIIPFIKHNENNPTIRRLWFNKQLIQNTIMFLYKKCILTKSGKIIILVAVAAITGSSIESALRIQQKFDPVWFLPEHTYLYKYTMEKRLLYPDKGYEASIYMGALNYSMELPTIMAMSREIEAQNDIVYNIDSWVYAFYEFMHRNYNIDLNNSTSATALVLNDDQWKLYLAKFLMSKSGGKYQAHFRFDEKLKCGTPIGKIIASSIPFNFRKFEHRDVYVPAMHRLEAIVKGAKLNSGDGFATVWAKAYSTWVTDETIDVELLRNLSIALISVMLCTLIFIVDFQVCFWIFICVLLTLINVCGLMERWNITIDLMTCIGLQLAVGLCVDYAAHIGHKFLTIPDGTRNERALETVREIGPAIFYGGFSTLLALSMLSASEAYTFQTFFKIFLLVIVFGLFHGVVFLPVILSLIGPKAYAHCRHNSNNNKKYKYKVNEVANQHNDGDYDESGTEMKTFISNLEPTENGVKKNNSITTIDTEGKNDNENAEFIEKNEKLLLK